MLLDAMLRGAHNAPELQVDGSAQSKAQAPKMLHEQPGRPKGDVVTFVSPEERGNSAEGIPELTTRPIRRTQGHVRVSGSASGVYGGARTLSLGFAGF